MCKLQINRIEEFYNSKAVFSAKRSHILILCIVCKHYLDLLLNLGQYSKSDLIFKIVLLQF